MKKTFTLAMGLVLASSSMTTALATVTKATTKAEFTAAWSTSNTSADVCDTIYVMNDINTGSFKADVAPTAGTYYIIGVADSLGNKPKLATGIEFNNNEENSKFSVIFEDLVLAYRAGATATSGQIIYANKKETHIDTLAIRRCDISDYARTIYRSVPPAADADGVINYGSLAWFEISDCTIHYANITSGNCWACIVMGSPVDVIDIHNNTFYDLPYNKQIFSMSYIDATADRNDTEVLIKNNNFFIASNQTTPLFQFDNCLGQMSSYNISNNIFMRPTWESEYVLPQTTDSVGNGQPTQIFRASYGIMSIKDNIIDDTFKKGWAYGIKLDEEGEGNWLEADTVAGISLAEAELSWSECAAPDAGDFTMWKGIKAYTLGEESSIIGNPNNYSDIRKVKAAFNISIEGSQSASYTLTPEKDQYFVGETVTIALNTKGDINTFKGWNDGNMDMIRVIDIEGDVNLTATFEEIKYVAIWDFNELTANNKNFTLPYSANYDNTADSAAMLGLKKWDEATQAFVDSATVQSRNNKFDVDTIINCLQLKSSFADSANHVIGDKGVFPYVYFPTTDLASATVSAYLGTDNYTTKKHLMDYSLDGSNWTNFGSAEISEAGVWTKFEAALPTAALNQPKVYVRWTVDATCGEYIEGAAQELSGEYTYEFHYIGGIRILSDEANAIEAIEADKSVINAGVIYDIMGRKATNTVSGQLYIQNGKKFIQK